METLLLYAFLTTASHYLGARAVITRAIWSRYPKWLDGFMLCAACAGTWYGFLVGMLGWWLRLPFLGLSGRLWVTPILVGGCSMIWTPIVAYLHDTAMRRMEAARLESMPDAPKEVTTPYRENASSADVTNYLDLVMEVVPYGPSFRFSDDGMIMLDKLWARMSDSERGEAMYRLTLDGVIKPTGDPSAPHTRMWA
jgi:hypothetical protein